jgi:hypothetical protein
MVLASLRVASVSISISPILFASRDTITNGLSTPSITSLPIPFVVPISVVKVNPAALLAVTTPRKASSPSIVFDV